MDKVLPGQIFILIRFNVKDLTQVLVNPQQIWMNFDMKQEFSPYFVIYMDLSLGFVTWICHLDLS